MRSLIVYYSRTGQNHDLAERIAEKLKTDLMPIESRVEYGGWLGFAKGGFGSVTKKAVPIKEPAKDPGKYDQVVLLSPVWAGLVPPPTRAFLEKFQKKIKKLSLVSVSAEGKKNERFVNEIESIWGNKLSNTWLYSDKEANNGILKEELDKIITQIKK